MSVCGGWGGGGCSHVAIYVRKTFLKSGFLVRLFLPYPFVPEFAHGREAFPEGAGASMEQGWEGMRSGGGGGEPGGGSSSLSHVPI